MAASTASVDITDAEYTALSAGQATVLVQVRNHQAIRLHVGASAPVVGTAAYIAVPGEGESDVGVVNTNFNGLGSGDNVYGRAESGSVSVAVLKA